MPNMSELIDEAMTSSISFGDGQMSRMNTSLPSLSWPSGSLNRSTSIEPASA